LLKNYLEATWAHTESSWEYRRAVLHLLEPMLAGVPDHSASLAIAGVRAESVGETPP
jgi:hypothetical protein